MSKLLNIINEMILDTLISEGVYDKGILKAFFLAGGPGSGKSFVAGKITAGQGIKFINSDTFFEKLLRDAEMSFDIDDLQKNAPEEYAKAMDLRRRAKDSANKVESNYLIGRLPVVYDGTGADFTKIQKLRKKCEELGYDTYMIFVNTSLEVAKQRNQKRNRTVPEDVLEEDWYNVQNNLGKFQNEFGSSNVIIVDNNVFNEDILNKVWKRIKVILDKPLKNQIGKKWIKMELDARKNNYNK
jgi:predicted kinase